MSRRAYPAYKPSGITWLGGMPSHWKTYRLKYCADPINEKVDGRDSELQYTALENIESWTGKRIAVNETATSDGQASRYRKGDVLFGKLRPYLAKALCAREDGVCTGELLVLRPRRVIQNYLFNYVLTSDFISVVDSSTYGVKMPRANWEFISNLPMLVPPEDEQRAIATFLDRETARIDRLIAKKERQIEVLQEKRAALISHAVTKGLNPNAKMKDSGIEWLGEIPEHWRVNKLKYLLRENLVNGLFKKKEFFGSGVKLINVLDVYRKDFLVDSGSLERVEANKSEQGKYAVHSGDIFFVRSSLKVEGVGRSVCAISLDEPTLFECHVVQARPIPTLINPKFLVNFLNSVYAINRLISLSNVVTMATIDQDKIKSLQIPVPPRKEQDEIMTFLDREISAIDTLEKRIHESVGKLREYRSALISAAVTGKIDVCQEVG